MMGQKQAVPCHDCVDGYCTMNCGPAAPNETALKIRANRAIVALRRPDPSLARIPNTVRDGIASVIEELVILADASA